MKVYYFTIMAIGIMFLFGFLGIETISNGIISGIGQPFNYSSSIFWVAVAVAIVGFAATTTRIGAGSTYFQVTTESVIAVFIGVIYLIFVADLYSIITYVNSITDSTTKWTYYVLWAILVPFIVGYGISVIEFIRGTD